MPLLAVVRRVLALAMVLAGVSLSLVVVSAPANASSDAYDFLSRVNASRASHGLKALTMRSDLVSVAAGWTKHMADTNSLEHNPKLTSQVKNWRAVGENVGVGPTVKDIEDAFMNSAHHRDNILDKGYTEIGIATVRDSRGALWVTQDFRQPMTTTTAAAPKKTTTKATSSTPRRAVVTPRKTIRSAVVVRSPLAERLAVLTKAGTPKAADPVARAVSYVSTMAALTG